MTKKCIVCAAEAVYKIKDSADYYCLACAEENFSDLSLLVAVEDEAHKLKKFLAEKIEEENASDKNQQD